MCVTIAGHHHNDLTLKLNTFRVILLLRKHIIKYSVWRYNLFHSSLAMAAASRLTATFWPPIQVEVLLKVRTCANWQPTVEVGLLS